MSTPFKKVNVHVQTLLCETQTGHMRVPNVRLRNQRTISSSSPHLVLLVCGTHTLSVAQPRHQPHPRLLPLCSHQLSGHHFSLLNVQAKTTHCVLTASISPRTSAAASRQVFLPGSSSGLDDDVGRPGAALGEIQEPSSTERNPEVWGRTGKGYTGGYR